LLIVDVGGGEIVVLGGIHAQIEIGYRVIIS
jgi:hypothetical protein